MKGEASGSMDAHCEVRKLAANRILSTVATLASIPFEPLRACLVYELTPLPPGEHVVGEFDESESEGEGKAEKTGGATRRGENSVPAAFRGDVRRNAK